MNKKIGRALVVGAGIGGIRAALDLAETGYGVTLIDRAPHAGGILSQLDWQFPTDRCGMCKMLPLVHRDAASQFCLRKGLFHENIDLLLNTEISAIEGEAGSYTVSLKERPVWVDPERCVGCGACEAVCPVEAADAFNAGLGRRKAIYLPVPHNIPNTYVLDLAACTHCGACEAVCPTGAIDLPADRREGFRILVVDDEAIVRDSLKAWLEDEGFPVDTAGSGPEALDLLSGRPFNLMLTDIKMPGMDGVELLKAAAEAHPDLSVLMMTAYATVETAVEAMKIGALDYLVKPFDPDAMIPLVMRVYEDREASRHRKLTVGAVVLAGGTDYFNPADEKNPYGYGVNPNVVTAIQFERMLSGTGPSRGRLVRPHDGRPVRRIAWMQCVGSRDLQRQADFCSSVCCMIAVKEAMLAKARAGADVETAIFYMDMRTFGKSFQRYRDHAEHTGGVRFERTRVHSITPDAATGDPVIRYVRTDGTCLTENFDLAVLAVGQRPAPGTARIADMAGIERNPWGFIQCDRFSPAATAKPGIVSGGAFSGLKDIGESVVQASAAALEASRVIHAAGGGLADTADPVQAPYRDVSREPPRILAAICSCGGRYSRFPDVEQLEHALLRDPCVERVIRVGRICTSADWEQLCEQIGKSRANRIVIGACNPYLYVRKLRELARRIHLDPALMDVVDIMGPVISRCAKPAADATGPGAEGSAATDPAAGEILAMQSSVLQMAVARLRHMALPGASFIPVSQRALVVGGGIAGMTAALAIADHGYPVDLVERSGRLGGNLNWLGHTLDGASTGTLLTETAQRVQGHARIRLHLESRVVSAFGEVGAFYTTVADDGGSVETLEHGVTILATGGGEAPTASYGYGTTPAVVTQKELESRMESADFDPGALGSVVMIQCVDSRREPRNYCSRVCCPTALKHALALKARNPGIGVTIFYRDIMTHGFTESYFTRAREAGVMFIAYDPGSPPAVSVPEAGGNAVRVVATDPLLGRSVEISADLLVLATGMVPTLPSDLASAYGIDTDRDGFFAEAESKWRPVDALREGVFACGIVLSPRSVPESIATAGAAAQRCLKILARDRLPAGKATAVVRHSLCSLCERCIEACPYGARTLDPDARQVAVNPAMCQGCGECASTCPNSAALVTGFTSPQVMEMIDAALG